MEVYHGMRSSKYQGYWESSSSLMNLLLTLVSPDFLPTSIPSLITLIELAPMKEELTERAFTIASYALCGFANLGSLGIQIGVLSALAPARGRVISGLAFSAMVCGFVSSHLATFYLFKLTDGDEVVNNAGRRYCWNAGMKQHMYNTCIFGFYEYIMRSLVMK
jgi:hypothetical protein